MALANWAGARGISIDNLVTFDPFKFLGQTLNLEYDNAARASNFFQLNPHTRIAGLPTGNNPYRGTYVYSEHVSVNNTNYTGWIDLEGNF